MLLEQKKDSHELDEYSLYIYSGTSQRGPSDKGTLY